jgi:hypothetical protein
MSNPDEDRIANLENKVEQLQRMFQDAVEVVQNIGGGDRMYQAVVVALMESHPDTEAMANAVSHHLEKQFTSIHFETLPESHVEGAEGAHRWLSAVVAEAKRKRAAES